MKYDAIERDLMVTHTETQAFRVPKVVGKGKSCPLHTGDEIEVLPKNRCGFPLLGDFIQGVLV